MSLPIGSAQLIQGLDSLEEELLLLTTLFLEENPLHTFLLASDANSQVNHFQICQLVALNKSVRNLRTFEQMDLPECWWVSCQH